MKKRKCSICKKEIDLTKADMDVGEDKRIRMYCKECYGKIKINVGTEDIKSFLKNEGRSLCGIQYLG